VGTTQTPEAGTAFSAFLIGYTPEEHIFYNADTSMLALLWLR